MWCVAELDDEFIDRMEDVLDLYEKPYCVDEPVVCLDEKPIVLRKNICSTSRRARPGKTKIRDCEYSRRGTANAFCVVEPLAGNHIVKITKNRKSDQFAQMIRDIGRAYSRAKKIHLVMDNLNTHRKKSLITHLGPKRGLNLWNRLEVHYTPKHGSWLNQAEIEISMFSRECLGKDRIATILTLRKRATAWERQLNRERRKINWKFKTGDAREKFKYYT